MRIDCGIDLVPDLRVVEATVRGHLEPLGNRMRHSRAVAATAQELAPAVPVADRRLLVAAAWLHDIGYAPTVYETGMHAVDGARWLARQGYPPRLCALVAHHSAASYEAAERSVSLQEWPREESAVADALWASDMITGPTGLRVSYPERLAEILGRYPQGSVVHRSMIKARPAIEAAISRTSDRLGRPVSREMVSAGSPGRG